MKLFKILLCLIPLHVLAANDSKEVERIEKMFRMDPRTPGLHTMLKRNILNYRQKAVPTLIKVMKNGDYPDQNRWQATMLLAQVMGKKSAPFIAKFSEHPNWMMRLASLKALLGLSQKEYVQVYRSALADSSLIVRLQALDNISKLEMDTLGKDVWNMLYDHSNYSGSIGNRKRTSIVKSIIKTLGDIKFKQAVKPMAKLFQKSKYADISNELDYSLKKITGKKSPENYSDKMKFWSKLI